MPDESTLVATVAGGPQIVTFALDELLARGERIVDVIAAHLAPQADPLLAPALDRLSQEFVTGAYAGQRRRLQFFAVTNQGRKVDDIRDEATANAAWSAVYELIAGLKREGRRLHVCLAGGRRMLALVSTSAAMLHFDHDDRLWHLYAPDEFIERSRNGAILHARPEDGVRLIRVPIAPWGAWFPTLRLLSGATPAEAVAAQARRLDAKEYERCRSVVDRLTPRQRDTLRAFASGCNPQEAAERLGVVLKTVHAHKTTILAECRIAWELAEEARPGYYFLREKFGRFFDA